MIKKERLQAASAETMNIIEQGGYFNLSEDWVEISDAIDLQRKENMYYEPNHIISSSNRVTGRMVISVCDEDAVSAIIRMTALPEPICCLVFASARRPGGGFLDGANAQEESIARSSTLPMSLFAVSKFYELHKHNSDLRYSDAVIYTPHAQLFRNKNLDLLEIPVECAFITSSAPNKSAMEINQKKDMYTLLNILKARSRRILQIAAHHNHKRIILGAWGCGVFKNDPNTVALAFRDALLDEHGFDEVLFAIPKAGSDHHDIFANCLTRK